MSLRKSAHNYSMKESSSAPRCKKTIAEGMCEMEIRWTVHGAVVWRCYAKRNRKTRSADPDDDDSIVQLFHELDMRLMKCDGRI
jgi:hypothetical protein